MEIIKEEDKHDLLIEVRVVGKCACAVCAVCSVYFCGVGDVSAYFHRCYKLHFLSYACVVRSLLCSATHAKLNLVLLYLGTVRTFNSHTIPTGVRHAGQHDDLRPARVLELGQAGQQLLPDQPLLQATCARHGAERPAAGDRHDRQHRGQRPAGRFVLCVCFCFQCLFAVLNSAVVAVLITVLINCAVCVNCAV